MALEEEEALELPLLSDTEAALACVLGECPRGALLADGTVPCALWHAVYAVIHLPTNVDVELERLCHANAIRVLKLPAHGDERLVLRAEDYERALRSSDQEGANAFADALRHCTGTTCQRDELLAAMHSASGAGIGRCEAWLGSLQASGWLVPARQAVAAGPSEAPASEGARSADLWLWGMPHAGRLLYTLSKCRSAVLALLNRQKFGRTMRRTVEGAPALRKLLTQSKLDLTFVLRDLIGKRLIKSTDTTAGTVLELSPAGFQAAAAAAARGKKRGR